MGIYFSVNEFPTPILEVNSSSESVPLVLGFHQFIFGLQNLKLEVIILTSKKFAPNYIDKPCMGDRSTP